MMMEATNVGRHSKLVLVHGARKHTRGTVFYLTPEEPPPREFSALLMEHEGRLLALLDKPVILAVHWHAGDDHAVVQILPADGLGRERATPVAENVLAVAFRDRKYEEFRLPFPPGAYKGPRGGYAVWDDDDEPDGEEPSPAA